MDTDNNTNVLSVEEELNAMSDALHEQMVEAHESVRETIGRTVPSPTNVDEFSNVTNGQTTGTNVDDLESVLADNNENEDESAEVSVDTIMSVIDDRLI